MTVKIVLSSLPHTWILDVDGTLCVHNGHLTGKDTLLPGVKEFFDSIPKDDFILLLTSRSEELKPNLECFMNEHGLRFNQIVCNAPVGERILINDDKPSGLSMAFACRKKRDACLDLALEINPTL